MGRNETKKIANPTIAKVFKEFLAEQQERISPKTFAKYRDVISLLESCLNNYAYNGLDDQETELFEALYKENNQFCDVFGPDHILPNYHEFLGYFMVRKVFASKELSKAAGTVTRKLAKWLGKKGYVSGEDAEDAAETGLEASKDLPKANELSCLLNDWAEYQPLGKASSVVEDHFWIEQIEPGKIWVEGLLDGRNLGPIALPPTLCSQLKVGWTFSGRIGLVGKKWHILEVWNVYP